MKKISSIFQTSPLMSITQATDERRVLPQNITIHNYDLTIFPDLDNFKFEGTTVISFNVNEPVSTIQLNACQLKFHTAKLMQNSVHIENATSIQVDEVNEVVTIFFSDNPVIWKQGEFLELHITYSGELNNKMIGFYRSSYTDKAGMQRYMAVTQFAATHARMAFPCIDEPNRKSTFDVTLLVTNPSHIGLSNMELLSTKDVPYTSFITRKAFQAREYKFGRSPCMSTYLLAFIVGDMEHLSATTDLQNEEVTVRVFTPPGLANQGKFALNVAVKSIKFLESVFRIPYPLSKIDLVAIPDFDCGAMENWGLITYRMSSLLVDEKSSSLSAKQRVAYVVSHELAHQWFGNLVTMDWWNDLWLNEGFATWVGWYATDVLFKEWDAWSIFLDSEHNRGLGLDELCSSHPIQVTVNDPSQITQIFDAISYAKGASIIRMLSSYIGVEHFLDGVRNYLEKYKYSNAVTHDLWAELSKVSAIDVGKLMHEWTAEVGCPVICVEEIMNCGQPQLLVSQKRYILGSITNLESNTLWSIPINLSVCNMESRYLLHDQSEPISLDEKFKSNSWEQIYENFPDFFYKLNTSHTGFYRVAYSSRALLRLGKCIENQLKGVASKNQFSTNDRIGLVNDIFWLNKSGLIPSSDVFNLVAYFKHENEYLVWNEIAQGLSYFRSTFYQESDHITDSLRKFTCSMFQDIIGKIGWDESHEESEKNGQLRSIVLLNAGRAGDTRVTEEAHKRFKLFLKGDDTILHPNIRSTVFKIVVATGSKEEYNAVKNLFKNSSTVDQRLAALQALGFTKDTELIKQTLAYSLNEEVRPQDVTILLSSLSDNPVSRELLWEFTKANFGQLYNMFEKSLRLLSRIVGLSLERFADLNHIEDANLFFSKQNTEKYSRSLEQALETIAINETWRRRERKGLEDWATSS